MAEIHACLHWVTILFQTTACFPREYEAEGAVFCLRTRRI